MQEGPLESFFKGEAQVSTSQPRDADVDRLLRAVLRPAAGGPAGVCPDPDTLAAWVEGGLSLEERASLESHFVGCGRCQEALAVIGAEAPVPQPAPARTGWFTWVAAPRLRWLVPITAAATVAVFFFATRPLIAPGDETPAADAAVQMARAEPSPGSGRVETPASEATAAPMTQTVPEEKGAVAGIPAQTGAAAKGAAGSGAANEGRDRLDAVAPARPAAELETQMARREAGLADEAAAPPAPPLPAAGAQVAPSAERAVRDKKEAPEALGSEALRVNAVPPPASTFGAVSVVAPKPAAAAADAPHPTTVALQESAMPRGVGPPPAAAALHVADAQKDGEKVLLVTAPGGAVRWQFGQDGRVRRSVDGGKSWQEQLSRVAADAAAGLNAGSAPSPNVCWVVGSGGMVLLTIDGETWQRLPFPSPLDLVSVRADDARSAAVIARDGRRFETRDGGLTWR